MLKKLLILSSVLLVPLVSSTVLAMGDAEAGKQKSATCAACHGAQGVSAIPLNPNLAAQVPGYISRQLADFKAGVRKNALMQGQSMNLSQEDMDDLDAYYAGLPAQASSVLTQEDLEMAAVGEKIYRGGYAARGISACMSCHGPSGHGIPKNYPRVAAQHKEYLEQQLLAYKKGERLGYNSIMYDIAFGLSEQQIKELAAYMAGLN
jgi:cytochrome c553